MTLIITGTSKGIGRGLAEHFLARGAQVAGCSRGPATIMHPAYAHHQLDVADEAAVVAMVRGVARQSGSIDGLVNNAGIAAMNPVALTPLASVQAVLATNFVGTFLFCREVGKIMQRQGGGRIVNFTTVAEPWRLEGEGEVGRHGPSVCQRRRAARQRRAIAVIERASASASSAARTWSASARRPAAASAMPSAKRAS